MEENEKLDFIEIDNFPRKDCLVNERNHRLGKDSSNTHKIIVLHPEYINNLKFNNKNSLVEG